MYQGKLILSMAKGVILQVECKSGDLLIVPYFSLTYHYMVYLYYATYFHTYVFFNLLHEIFRMAEQNF